jgi:hypothetical protein
MKTLITPKYYIPLNELESISEVMETIGYMADRFPSLKSQIYDSFHKYESYQNTQEYEDKIKVQATILLMEILSKGTKNEDDFFHTFREVMDGGKRRAGTSEEHGEAMNRILSEKYAFSEDCLIDLDRYFPIRDLINLGFLIETEGGHKALVEFSKRYTLDDSEIEALEEIIEYTEKTLGCRVKFINATPRPGIDKDPYMVFELEPFDSDEELIIDPKVWDRFKNTLTDATTPYAVYSAMNFSTPDLVEQLVFLFSSRGND